ncbi:MAG: TrlF family AAA-like ATPase [Bacteroidales bacterium]
MNYNRGSEWRKWDLHIHTPETAKNNNFGNNADVWEKYIVALENNTDIAVLGITDYFSIDNYKTTRDFQKGGRLVGKTILPNVELRITPVTKTDTPINIHVIFNPKLTDDFIEREFFRALSYRYKERNYQCIKQDLIALGRAYKNNNSLDKTTAYYEGVGQYIISYDELKNLIEKDCLKDNVIIAVSNSNKDGNSGIQHSSLAATREEIYRMSHIIFSGNPKDISYFLGKSADSEESIKNKFKSLMPCITGSDAHSFDKINIFTDNRTTWIKADPSFEGLKQVLNEPFDRVFIGHKPPLFEKIDYNKTKYINKLRVNPIDNYNGIHGEWFDFEMNFNPGLVAIIGNKGSGKSAIADIIALCSNIDNQDDFSFLRGDKFRGKNKPAQYFNSKLSFMDGVTFEKNLNDSLVVDSNKLIKYLPQGYFERICNEITKVEQFQKEIESVVFQYIDFEDRLGALDFEDLINIKTSRIETVIEHNKREISILIEELIRLEKKENIKYKQSLLDKIDSLNKEISALDSPVPVEDPNKDALFAKTNKEITEYITSLTKEIETLIKEIENNKTDKANINIEIQDLQDIRASIKQTMLDFDQIKNKTNLTKYNINWNELVNITFNEQIIENQINDRLLKIKTIDKLLGNIESETIPLTALLKEKQALLEQKQSELTGPQKLYQDYLSKQELFNKRIFEINGDITTSSLENIYGLKQELDFIDKELKNKISLCFNNVISKISIIYQLKKEVISIYELVKQKIDEKINHNSDILEGINIEINALLNKNFSFENKLLQFIDKSVRGSFYGTVDSQQRLSSIVESVDFNNFNEVKLLITEIRDNLKEDKRTSNSDKRYIEEQVKDLKSFYEYLFFTDYLESSYNLKQDGKILEHLSPGEKGALLLVFYLLLDMDNKPLVLDQPEDNLDNASVANTLVKFIKRAKSNRQIIIVTHNPNLAVVSDADQIIYVNIDKKNKNKFFHESGSIENPIINKHIVDVLEGAMPAFRKRDDKYYEKKD